MAHDQLADAISLIERPPLVDIHVHLHPPRLFAAIRRWFAERSDWTIEHDTDPAAVARALRAAGVERFVFCSYAHKTGMARDLNLWLARTSRELNGYGLALATVHLDDPDPAGDIAAAFDDGCIGLKIHEDVQRLAIDDPRFSPVLDIVAERAGFVLVHVGPVPWSDDTDNGPARVARVLDRHPSLRVVVAHFGVPDCAGYAERMPEYPNLYLDTTMAFTPDSSLEAHVDRAFVEGIGGRVVFGTDYPNTPHGYAADIDGLIALGISPQTLREIASENARRLAPALSW